MSVQFNAAEYLTRARSMASLYPLSVGMLAFPRNAGAAEVYFGAEAFPALQFIQLYYNTDNTWKISAYDGGFQDGTTSGTFALNLWHFVLARWISPTNRRVSALNLATGEITHGQNTVSVDPTFVGPLINFGIGAFPRTGGNPATGRVAEYWMKKEDIQADGAETDPILMRKLAHHGLFFLPSARRNLLEYDSFRHHALDNKSGEVYFGDGIKRWVAPNGIPTVAPHPNLRGDYARPYSFDVGVPLFLPDVIAPPPPPPPPPPPAGPARAGIFGSRVLT